MNIRIAVKSLLKGGGKRLLTALMLMALSSVVSAENGGSDPFVADEPLARVEPNPVEAELAADETSARVQEFASDEVLVRFRPGAGRGAVAAARQGLGAAEIKVIPRIDVHHWRVPQGVEKALERLLRNPNVEYAEPNGRWFPCGFVGDAANPGDPSFTLRADWPFGYQEHLNHDVFHLDPGVREIHAEEAWDSSLMGAGAIVAVIDTGCDMDHPDLDGNLLFGKNLMRPGKKPPDDNYGHGTHVAGIIAAEINNFGDTLVNTAALDASLGDGVGGVAPMAQILPIKAGSPFTWDRVAEGIVWAADNGADIANLSLGGSYSQTAQDAIDYAYLQKDMLIIASAGNSNLEDPDHHPAAGAYTLSVAAVDSTDTKARFSNYGFDVDIAAPGVSILSTLIDDDANDGRSGAYGRMSGTSMASPMVAGIAALIKSQYPSFGAEELGAQILNTAFNIDAENPELIGKLGAGRIDAAQAVAAEEPPGVLIALTRSSESRDLIIHVKFSHVMNAAAQDESGYDTSILNPMNYLLVNAGPDGLFGGDPSDDEVIPLSLDPATVYERFPGRGITLATVDAPDGDYQFFVPFDGAQTATGRSLGSDFLSEFHWLRPSFDVETVREGSFSKYDLALAPDHLPAIVYTDEAASLTLTYGKWDGVDWTFEPVDSETATGMDIEFDPIGGEPWIPYISAVDSGLYLAKRRDTGAWDIELIDTGVGIHHVQIGFDPSGEPAVAYTKKIDSEWTVYFAWFDGSAWNYEIVGPGFAIGTLAWDPYNSRFALCTSRIQTVSEGNELLYYTRTGSNTWASEAIYSGENPRETSLGFDPVTGYPGIASAGDLESDRGRFSRYDGVTWITEDFTPEDTTTKMNGVRFAYNSSGTPYIAYDSESRMHVTFWDGFAWRHYTIDDGDYFDPRLFHAIEIHPIDQVPVVLYGAGHSTSDYYSKARLKLATFISRNTTPTVTISSPANGDVFPDGDTVAMDFAGLASDAEDGDLTASLAWTSDVDGSIGNGGSFSTTLTVGDHLITASVTDSGEMTGSASVSITVGDPPPAAPTGLVALEGDSVVDLDWDDNGETDLAGYNVYRSLTSADPSPILIASSVATSNYLDTDVVNGTTYYYVVTAVDLAANESPASDEVSATPSAQPAVHVENITMSLVSAGRNSKGEATVLIHDGTGAAVSGATVVGDWLLNGAPMDTGVSNVTDSGGNAVLTSTPAKAKSGDVFTFVVTNVVQDGTIYDSSANVETEDSITVQ